jgi:hypothetical protein
MNCDCGNRAFFFEKITTDGTFRVFKCESSETKKKNKCKFFYTEKVKEPTLIGKNTTTCVAATRIKTFSIDYVEKLKSSIKLFKNSSHLPRELNATHEANINYFLKQLNMPLFFEKKETISQLELRIDLNTRNKTIEHVNIFPVKLIEFPEELSVPKKPKRIKKIKKKTVRNNVLDLCDLIKKDEEYDIESKDKNLSSDYSEESDVDDNENDNTFDIDSYDSAPDDDLDDMGAFSD